MKFFRKYFRKSAAVKAAVLLTAVCGCIFSACGTNSSDHYTGSPEQADTGSDRKSGSAVPDISSDNSSDELVSLIQHTGLFSRFCSTDEGFYYLTEKQTELSGGTTVITITGETDTETRPSVLYRMNPDGSGREQIYTFDDNATVEDVAFGGPGGLYFVTKKLGTAQISSGTYTTASGRQLICFDPDSRKTRSVCPLDFGDGLNWEVIG